MFKILDKIKNIGLTTLLVTLLLLTTITYTLILYNTPKQIYAFPSAQGYGAFTTGGRGGVVYHVKTLSDNNEIGSLRYAVNQSGARTIVFDVTGNIELNSPLQINSGDLTIAGQSAPGEGVCIKNYPVIINADNVIVRFIKFRLGDKSNGSSLVVKNRRNIIIDHCSLSWASTDNVSLYNNRDITMQWCIISESLYKGVSSGIGATLGGYSASYHHNLFASNQTSNPEFLKSNINNNLDIEIIDFRNNILYNWGTSSIEGSTGKYNIVNNYYRFGPATNIPSQSQIINIATVPKNNIAYVSGNYIYTYPLQTNDNWMGVYPNTDYIKTSQNTYLTRFEFDHAPVCTHTPNIAFGKILEYAGASLLRDDVDKRITQSVETYVSGAKSSRGIISTPDDVGGYPIYKKTASKADSDGDGISDEWEYKHGLNPYDAGDGKIIQANGYSNLEIYLNDIVKEITSKENTLFIPNLDMFKIMTQMLANKIKKI